MKALIDPRQDNRICQVEENDFPVAEPLYWVECHDECTSFWTYDGNNFYPPTEIVKEPITEPTKEELLAKLLELQAQLEAMK